MIYPDYRSERPSGGGKTEVQVVCSFPEDGDQREREGPLQIR